MKQLQRLMIMFKILASPIGISIGYGESTVRYIFYDVVIIRQYQSIGPMIKSTLVK